ncbi:MAG: hypothetical protein ABMA64_21000 [Myxococcota bacterium]
MASNNVPPSLSAGETRAPSAAASDASEAPPATTSSGRRTGGGSLLATDYPSAAEWRTLLETFDSKAIAHKLLLAHVPFVFRNEPLKFALFRRTIGDAFGVEPSNVFIVGSAMAGRSLKGDSLDKEYNSGSDIDTLIVSEHLFTKYLMSSLQWVAEITKPAPDKDPKNGQRKIPAIDANARYIGMLAMNASRGIWRPDSLPKEAIARRDFFDRFSDVSLKTLGLQLSDDTVAHVNGRVARSFQDAVNNLASSLRKLGYELDARDTEEDDEADPVL